MKSKHAPQTLPSNHGERSDSERDQISQNIGAVHEFYEREGRKISRSQRILERASALIGQPAFLAVTVLFVAIWMLVNTGLRAFGKAAFDPPPFSWLQGIVGLAALLTTTIVLTKQNRLAGPSVLSAG